MTFTVAIVGRPNVGKSSLFNKLVGRRLALVDDQPGLTRDRRVADAELGDMRIRLIDTAGLEDSGNELLSNMRRQTMAAIGQADLVLFLIDAREGVIPADQMFAGMVRDSGKPVIVAGNKCEGRAAEPGLMEAYSLGFGEPIALSAEHAIGLGDVSAAIVEAAEAQCEARGEGSEVEEGDERPLKLAIVGRPNAGKSTLVNALLGEERMITGSEAGITRDAIANDLEWAGRPIELFDTAGLRRKMRVEGKAETLSVGDALRAIRFAEVVVLVIDAERPFEKQDLTIADLIIREGRGIVIALNKWDLVRDKQGRVKELREMCERLLPQAKGVPLLPISGLKSKGLDALMAGVFEMARLWNKRLPTAKLNDWLIDMVEAHPPPHVGGRRLKLRYMTQVNARPPTFVAFCSKPKDLPESYIRYLVNGLREDFKMPGVPIRFNLRKGENPYAGKARARR
ncbi:ribosome biogenesis GTPase Der [Methyloligella solikamskensis]|uniref:GTPase Der n=1 Tax=Methyloligella solikamskensis TaxID=1177756 RepID=A0ABW3J9U3_9HYPH